MAQIPVGLMVTSQESRNLLKDWLQNTSAMADRAFGEEFRDPALTALYCGRAGR
jgi:hypothetical protein